MTLSVRRLSSFVPCEHDRHRECERQQCVEVIELHRQIERVRRDRAGDCRREAPGERAHARGEWVACGCKRTAELARVMQTAEYPEDEEREDDRADDTGLDDERDEVRVRSPVRLAGDELVV